MGGDIVVDDHHVSTLWPDATAISAAISKLLTSPS